MRLSFLLPVLSALCSLSFAASSPSQPISADVFYWPVSSLEPSVLARISYDPTSSKPDLIFYTPPDAVDLGDQEYRTQEDQNLVRIGLYTSTATNPKQWVGTLASLSALKDSTDHKPTIRLHLNSLNEVYHVSMAPSSASAASSASTGPSIELVHSEAGPRPHLNRPIVISPDGTNPEEVVEKTLFQKYWWVFLIITFLAMSGGGEGQ